MAKKYLSPCCRAPSEVRQISISQNVMALRCSCCTHLRIEPFDHAAKAAPKLRLIVNH